MKQRFIALICIATLVFCGCGGKKQSSVQTDSGSEQPEDVYKRQDGGWHFVYK